jgi:hypothetical protein
VISFYFLSDVTDLIAARVDASNWSEVAVAAHVGGMAFGMALIGLGWSWLRKSGALDWIDEQDDEPTVGVLTATPAPAPSAAWHTSDLRVQSRMPSQPAAAVPMPAAISEAATIYLSWDGVNYGPYSLAQILPMFKRGEIPINASYWQQGMEEWRSAEELRDPGTG